MEAEAGATTSADASCHFLKLSLWLCHVLPSIQRRDPADEGSVTMGSSMKSTEFTEDSSNFTISTGEREARRQKVISGGILERCHTRRQIWKAFEPR